MKKLSVFILLCSVFTLLAAVPEFLVMGDKPGRLEKIAAEELQLFYSKIYGKALKVVSADAAKGNSDVGALKRGCIIDSVSGHGNNVSIKF